MMWLHRLTQQQKLWKVGEGKIAHSNRILKYVQLEQLDYFLKSDLVKGVSSLCQVGSPRKQNGFRDSHNLLGITLVKDKGERAEEEAR